MLFISGKQERDSKYARVGQIFARTNFVPGPPVYMDRYKLNSVRKQSSQVLRKHARWLVKNRVCITRWRHRTSARCWRSDDVSKENLHFDNQSLQVVFLFLVALFSKRNGKHVLRVSIELYKHSWKFGRTRKSCGNTRVPTAFLVLPNFHSCLYNSIETRNMFSIS